MPRQTLFMCETSIKPQEPERVLVCASAPAPMSASRQPDALADAAGAATSSEEPVPLRPDPVAPNGITEYLIAQSAIELGQRGFSRLSMNFAAWGRLFSPSPCFQITSLRAFNAKFGPEWV